MSVLRPKTIILSAQSVRPIRASIGGDGSLFVGQQTVADYDSLMEDDEVLECAPPNKRRRLNFLSPEQKLVRRKLKNRVAAQTARDRKKQRMTELEEALASLQAENDRLAAENSVLKQSSSELVQENSRLRQRLDMSTTEIAGGNSSDVKSEPAVLNTPLPREQTRTEFHLPTFCVTLLALLSLTQNSLTRPSSDSSRPRKDAQTETGAGCALQMRNRHQPPMKWWGRHQHSWNPAMN